MTDTSDIPRKAAWTFARSHEWADVDDLTQEAEIAAWRARPEYDPTVGTDERAWVYSRCWWALRDYARRAGPYWRGSQRQPDGSHRDVWYPRAVPDDIDYDRGGPACDGGYAEAEVVREIVGCRDQLGPRQYETLILTALGYGRAEIGRREGLSDCPVHKRLRAARQVLEQKLAA